MIANAKYRTESGWLAARPLARCEVSAPSFTFTRHAVGGFKTASGISPQVQGERESTFDPAHGFIRRLSKFPLAPYRRKSAKALHIYNGVSIKEGEAGEFSPLSQDQQATLHRVEGSSRRSKTSCSMARDRMMSNAS